MTTKDIITMTNAAVSTSVQSGSASAVWVDNAKEKEVALNYLAEAMEKRGRKFTISGTEFGPKFTTSDAQVVVRVR